jgi:hypothetical protein
MVRLYDVYCGERFCGRYLAMNEQSAINQSFMKTGEHRHTLVPLSIYIRQ